MQGGTPDHLGLMPITMMFAAQRIAANYGRYALDHQVLVEAQLRTAEEYNLDHVSAITETREAPDCGAELFFDDQPYALSEERSRRPTRRSLPAFACPIRPRPRT